MKLVNYNFPRLGLILAALISLASCGGGGGGGGSATPAAITSISPLGIVQSTTRNIVITGNNFTNGMTLSLTSSLGTQPVTPTSVTSSTIFASVTISSAPTERYVKVNIISNGSTVASTILGVASVSKVLQSTPAANPPATTDIQYIFNTYCGACHGTSGNLDLSTKTLSASNLIQTVSSGPYACANRNRVTAGDPRATSSFLIDKLNNNTPCGGGSRMPMGATTITQTEIDAITEWIAGGAN